MLLLRAADFGADGVLRARISTITTDTGARPVVANGAYVLVTVDGQPGRAYILCFDQTTDTLNLALAGSAS